MDYSETIIQAVIGNFDFTYCLVVNILTYVVIKTINEIRTNKLKSGIKKLVTLAVILSTGVVYWLLGKDMTILVNSSILSLVSWSWLFKPICDKLGVGYNDKLNDTAN